MKQLRTKIIIVNVNKWLAETNNICIINYNVQVQNFNADFIEINTHSLVKINIQGYDKSYRAEKGCKTL